MFFKKKSTYISDDIVDDEAVGSDYSDDEVDTDELDPSDVEVESEKSEYSNDTPDDKSDDPDYSNDVVQTKKKTVKKKTEKKQRSAKSKKKKAATQDLSKTIPYDNVYKELGMFSKAIDKERQVYSVALKIGDVDPKNVVSEDPIEMNNALTALLNGFGNVNYQFFTINRRIDEQCFLDEALFKQKAGFEKYVDAYNDVIKDNSWIGHNNMRKDKYIIFSVIAYTPDEALSSLQEIREKAIKLFNGYYSLKLYDVSVEERLELIYNVYNMGGDSFGMRAGFEAKDFKIDVLKKVGLTTKDMVKPKKVDRKKDYIILNDKLYARVFFISNFPAVLSGNLIAELTNISSQMVYSAYYEPLDAEYCFELAKKKVADNTIVKNQHEKTTLSDRKAGKIVQSRQFKESTERAYFDRAALDVLTESKAEETNIFMGSFLIIMYSDNMADLEKDTRLLSLSASKFAFQVKTLDYVQWQGINSALPLANCYVNVRRVFPVSKLCKLNPFDVNGALRENGMFVGMNSINDNIILMNRKNLSKQAGLIAGIRHSGKTFQVKREAVNNLIGTDDLVFIVSKEKEIPHYEKFVKNLGGAVIKSGNYDPFIKTENYGILDDGEKLKEEHILALFSSILRFEETKALSEIAEAEQELADEVHNVCQNINTFKDLDDYLYSASADLKHIRRAMAVISTKYLEGKDTELKRLNYFTADSDESMLLLIDKIWNIQIEEKKKNTSSWLYIDGIDGILRTPEGAKYLAHIAKLSNILQNPVTFVIQESARFSEGNEKYMFNELAEQIGYYKLLNQGPVERRMYVEKLSIPQSLVQYITNSALGKGLVIDASSSLPFNDNAREIFSDGDRIRILYDPE